MGLLLKDEVVLVPGQDFQEAYRQMCSSSLAMIDDCTALISVCCSNLAFIISSHIVPLLCFDLSPPPWERILHVIKFNLYGAMSPPRG